MFRRSAIVTIAITLGQLAAGRRSGWSDDQVVVLEALKRSTARLNESTEAELASYLRDLAPAQMRGVVSNVKGILHELLVARAENLDEDDVTAVLFELTNHKGADLEYVIDGQVISSVQVKAVQTPAAIIDHFSRYPNVDIVATSEITDLLSGLYGERLRDSGFHNAELTELTRSTFDTLTGHDLGDYIADGALTSALVAGALQARALLAGQGMSREEIRSQLELADNGIGTAVAVDTVISLL